MMGQDVMMMESQVAVFALLFAHMDILVQTLNFVGCWQASSQFSVKKYSYFSSGQPVFSEHSLIFTLPRFCHVHVADCLGNITQSSSGCVCVADYFQDMTIAFSCDMCDKT